MASTVPSKPLGDPQNHISTFFDFHFKLCAAHTWRGWEEE